MKKRSSVALVDDERNILTALGIALEAEGYDVRTFSDTASALERLPQSLPTWRCSTIRTTLSTAWSCTVGFANYQTCR